MLITGFGPTGPMFVGDLALAGVDVAVLERSIDRNPEGSWVGGMAAHTRPLALMVEPMPPRGNAWGAKWAGPSGVRRSINVNETARQSDT